MKINGRCYQYLLLGENGQMSFTTKSELLMSKYYEIPEFFSSQIIKSSSLRSRHLSLENVKIMQIVLVKLRICQTASWRYYSGTSSFDILHGLLTTQSCSLACFFFFVFSRAVQLSIVGSCMVQKAPTTTKATSSLPLTAVERRTCVLYRDPTTKEKQAMWFLTLLLLQLGSSEETSSAKSQIAGQKTQNFTLNHKDVQVLFQLHGK